MVCFGKRIASGGASDARLRRRRSALLLFYHPLAIGAFFFVPPSTDIRPFFFTCIEPQGSGAGGLEKGGNHNSSAVKTFRLEACQVSTVAKAFVSLVRATLTEACSDEVNYYCFLFYRGETRRAVRTVRTTGIDIRESQMAGSRSSFGQSRPLY